MLDGGGERFLEGTRAPTCWQDVAVMQRVVSVMLTLGRHMAQQVKAFAT